MVQEREATRRAAHRQRMARVARRYGRNPEAPQTAAETLARTETPAIPEDRELSLNPPDSVLFTEVAQRLEEQQEQDPPLRGVPAEALEQARNLASMLFLVGEMGDTRFPNDLDRQSAGDLEDALHTALRARH
eukprot:3275142-Amphidinium_carterae.1